MLSDSLYYPTSKVVNYKFAEDIENIRLNLAGTNLLYEDPDFNYFIGNVEIGTKGVMEAAEWRRPKEICKSPKFIDSEPHKFDALQGKLGDCWVVSAMEVLTLHKKLIKKVVPTDQSFDENYVGAFHFRIWHLGVWYDVVVDDRLPVYKKSKKLCYCTSRSGDVFWAALLEKAYAKFWVTDKVSYPDSLDTGSFMTSLTNFTGGIVEIICANPDYREEYGNLPSGTTLRTFLIEAYKRNALMCGVCCSRLSEASKLGMVTGHGYTITGVSKFSDDDPEFSHDGVGLFILRVLNPWGHYEFIENWRDDERFGGTWKNWWRKIDKELNDNKDEDEEDDGEFWINDVNFEKHFALVYVCHLGPGYYADSRNMELNWDTWKTTFFRGEWVKGVTAVGSDPKVRHKLPRYGIELFYPQNAVTDQRICYVVIHLTHRAKYRRYKNCKRKNRCKNNDLGVYIYDTTNEVKTQNDRVGDEFFKNNVPINEEPNWKVSDGRSYVLGMFMGCGRYCIVPCTHYADMDSQFLLRVFSTSDVNEWYYYGNQQTISKNAPIAEENIDYVDDRVHTLFGEIAQGQNEIDWNGLKYIFDAAFNPNPSLFEVFKSIANHILCVFGFFSSSRSSCFGNVNVEFTKDQCRSMIAMLDHNHSGKLEFSEFSQLWNKINFWMKVYYQHRDETAGLLQVDQLKDALGAIGYDISTRTVHSLSYVYADDEGMILLTDFVLCGVALDTALSRFDEETLGNASTLTLTLEEWVKNTLIL